MAMIFPGMDPYLEDPLIWPEVHSRMVVYLADHLQPRLTPRYHAAVERRVYLEGPDRDVVPDVTVLRPRMPQHEGGVAMAVTDVDEPAVLLADPLEIHESYVQILDLRSGQKIVTVIEVTGPSDKAPGPGRDSYQAKQREVLGSTAHLVEIDLLRTGQHVVAVPEGLARRRGFYDYLVCVNRGYDKRNRYEAYWRGLRERLPRVRIPLAGDDPDVALDVQAVVAQVYDAGDYRQWIDYHVPCRPPLRPEDQAWAELLIAQEAASQAPREDPA